MPRTGRRSYHFIFHPNGIGGLRADLGVGRGLNGSRREQQFCPACCLAALQVKWF